MSLYTLIMKSSVCSLVRISFGGASGSLALPQDPLLLLGAFWEPEAAGPPAYNAPGETRPATVGAIVWSGLSRVSEGAPRPSEALKVPEVRLGVRGGPIAGRERPGLRGGLWS